MHMPTSSFPDANENDSVRPVVQLDGLDADELRLVASFVDLVRNWREPRSSSGEQFQVLWHRMMARSSEILDDDVVMSVALSAQQAARHDGVQSTLDHGNPVETASPDVTTTR
jgi:hypothetical protein